MLKLCNVARNLALHDMRENLVIKKMNWYVEKIINMITENKCNYDIVFSWKRMFGSTKTKLKLKYKIVQMRYMEENVALII